LIRTVDTLRTTQRSGTNYFARVVLPNDTKQRNYKTILLLHFAIHLTYKS